MNARVVVFAYHNIGVRCLRVLLAYDADIALVITHQDNPEECIWFESVSAVAADYGLPVITLSRPPERELIEIIRAIQPDFIFSFYYRHMLPPELLVLAPQGAFNLHGSLLPKYRGRAPINWAVLNGETETGSTLHEMTSKPDAGAIVAKTLVPILPDDTACQVFNKVTVSAEQTLWQAFPALLADNAPRMPNDLSAGSYFSGRRPEDGRIDWSLPAQQVYNLVRSAAPPYPGAFTDVQGERFIIASARLMKQGQNNTIKLPLGLQVFNYSILGVCGDGRAIVIRELRHLNQSAPNSTSIDRVIDMSTFLSLTQSLSRS
ncbi:formyltransferase [Candidatus Vallotiella sp. (ex Adelges kitamiensis)]|uniref:formyltransferase n=1 Tax=Candidatus Vallotiella sp. (ex Adelges kitamiensis) TaxID=2864217 RepID=UPI001CE2D43F|nr:formyltransferase [Candidatus Vallotia sp. (ex Adelges kitamiensis)]